MGKLLKEFKEFAFRGNVIDMAVGVVIGSAFTGIVNNSNLGNDTTADDILAAVAEYKEKHGDF